MLDKFLKYISENQLFDSTQKVLLAVSGGKDSMAMFNLFLDEKYQFGVAHCNFKLRGVESDKDEKLVKQICEKNSIPFYVTSFNTKQYAEDNRLSIQMAARELRYTWFEEIRTTNNYNVIATAHHKNDVAETILINLTKGTGLSGLHGIKNTNNTVRPLLCFTREEINQYILENKIAYREDESNAETKYFRNAIRHKVLPELEELNSNVVENLNQTAKHLSGVEEILSQKVEEELTKCSETKAGKIYFAIDNLKQLKPINTYMYYFLSPYGFNGSDINDIADCLDADSGKVFQSDSHQIIKDRDNLILVERNSNKEIDIVINSIEEFKEKLGLSVQLVQNSNSFVFSASKNIAYLDFDKLDFPLKLRSWEEGDTFQPFGMKGKKKVSDFFIDEKVDIVSKKEAKILASHNRIVWVTFFI